MAIFPSVPTYPYRPPSRISASPYQPVFAVKTISGTGIINFSVGGNITGSLTATGGNWNGVGTLAGALNINSGTFNVNGTLGGGGTVPIATGATLGGTGIEL